MDFASQLLHWFQQQGRKHLPWQQAISPYRVWVSEIMLQQTQVATVIPYYERFMQALPSLKDLAQAPLGEVLKLWAGLGYYARARNLHKTANIIMQDFAGVFPTDPEILISLPGIGKSTAHAILAICFKQKLAILDGNVKRVLSRFKGITEYPGLPKIEKALWDYAETLLPNENLPAYTQAIMDLGAMICTKTKPHCLLCPVKQDCHAFMHQLTNSIPAAKPKRNYPIKTQICLLLYQEDSQKIFLELRPHQGIWGGLQAPLFFDDVASMDAWSKNYCISLEPKKILSERSHKFTHFQLNFTPWLIAVNEIKLAHIAAYSLHELDSIALPTPIKILLRELKADLIQFS